MFGADFQEIMEGLNSIEMDTSIPKNVRIKIKNAISVVMERFAILIDRLVWLHSIERI